MTAKFSEVTADFKDIRQEMQKLEYRMTIKLGAMVGAMLTIMTLIIKLA